MRLFWKVPEVRTNKKAFDGIISEINTKTMALNDSLTQRHEKNFMKDRNFS